MLHCKGACGSTAAHLIIWAQTCKLKLRFPMLSACCSSVTEMLPLLQDWNGVK